MGRTWPQSSPQLTHYDRHCLGNRRRHPAAQLWFRISGRPDVHIRSLWQRRGGLLARDDQRSEEHTSELQSLTNLVCRLLLEKKKITSVTLQTFILSKLGRHVEVERGSM